MELGLSTGKQPSVAHVIFKYVVPNLGNVCLSRLRIVESYGAKPKVRTVYKETLLQPSISEYQRCPDLDFRSSPPSFLFHFVSLSWRSPTQSLVKELPNTLSTRELRPS